MTHSTIVFDEREIATIVASQIQGGNVWENPWLLELKQKIKKHYRTILDEQCCYCRKNTLAEFNMVLDIEHILPKSKFPEYMFSTFNLSMSCKRCNMLIKKEDTSFITDLSQVRKTPDDSDLYRIIHPNKDQYLDHLRHISLTLDNKKLIKYTIQNNSKKGEFTYDYFRLKELEINSLNMAQGLDSQATISDLLDPEIVDEIRKLLQLK